MKRKLIIIFIVLLTSSCKRNHFVNSSPNELAVLVKYYFDSSSKIKNEFFNAFQTLKFTDTSSICNYKSYGVETNSKNYIHLIKIQNVNVYLIEIKYRKDKSILYVYSKFDTIQGIESGLFDNNGFILKDNTLKENSYYYISLRTFGPPKRVKGNLVDLSSISVLDNNLYPTKSFFYFQNQLAFISTSIYDNNYNRRDNISLMNDSMGNFVMIKDYLIHLDKLSKLDSLLYYIDETSGYDILNLERNEITNNMPSWIFSSNGVY